MKGDKEMICKKCGSLSVRRDADVLWNISAQCWELAGIYDNATCDDCGGETTIVEREYRQMTTRQRSSDTSA